MALQKKTKTRLINIAIAAVIFAVLFLLFYLRQVLLPFFLAILFAYLILPLVRFLQKRRLPLLLAVIIAYLILLVLLFLLFFFALPQFLSDAKSLLEGLPEFWQNLRAWWDALLGRLQSIELPQGVLEGLNTASSRLEEWIVRALEGMVNSIFSMFRYITSLVLAPILSYYLIRDRQQIQKTIVSWLPPKHRSEILRIAGDINHLIRQFLCGYLLVSLVVAVLSFIALELLGVPYALLLGIIMGLADLIPYFGPFFGAIPAVVLAYTVNFRLAVLTAITLVIVQQLEGSVISPKIMGDRIGLHPLTIILSVLIGGYLFGIAGMIFAVPVTAALKLLFAFLFSCAVAWRES